MPFIKVIKKTGTFFFNLCFIQRLKGKRYSGLIGIRCRGIFTSSAETRVFESTRKLFIFEEIYKALVYREWILAFLAIMRPFVLYAAIEVCRSNYLTRVYSFRGSEINERKQKIDGWFFSLPPLDLVLNLYFRLKLERYSRKYMYYTWFTAWNGDAN